MAIGDFEIDPSLDDGTFYVKPPPKHPKRCQAYNNRREQCQNWALRNYHYCIFHRGRKSRKQIRLSFMANKYCRRLNTTFKELLEEWEGDRRNITDISDEVDVARVLCEQTLKLVDSVFFVDKNEGKASAESKLTVLAHAQNALMHVSNLCEKLAKIQTLSDGVLNADQIEHLMVSIIRILERKVDGPILEDIVKEIRSLKTPKKDMKTVVIG